MLSLLLVVVVEYSTIHPSAAAFEASCEEDADDADDAGGGEEEGAGED